MLGKNPVSMLHIYVIIRHIRGGMIHEGFMDNGDMETWERGG